MAGRRPQRRYFGGLAEVRGPHDRRRYDGELFHILVAKIVEAVHRASGDAQRLPGTKCHFHLIRSSRTVIRPLAPSEKKHLREY